MIEVKSLWAGYDSTPVLRDVSLRVDDGEMLAVIGANGAGKTTLLRTISGVLPARSGSIRVDDRDFTKVRAWESVRSGVCHVPEGRHVFPGLTVEDNLRLGAYIHRRDAGLVRRRLDEALEVVPALASRLLIKAGALSGGQQQMLAIGRALMSGSKHLLMDEPSLGLAPLVMSVVFDTIQRLRNIGRTIILVEQNGRMALEIADHGVVLTNGNVVMSGPASTVAADPEIENLYLGGGGARLSATACANLCQKLGAALSPGDRAAPRREPSAAPHRSIHEPSVPQTGPSDGGVPEHAR